MCGASSSKVKEDTIREYPKILRAIQTFCEQHKMHVLDAAVKHFQNNNKWVVNIRSTKDDRIYRLELIVHDLNSCSKIMTKRMHGQHLMAYNIINDANGVICFLYKSLGDINQFVINQNLNTVDKKQNGLCGILADVMAGLKDLNRVGLIHQQMTWENVDVVRDEHLPCTYHGKVGGLENLVPKRENFVWKDLAPLQHCPPEALRWNPFVNLNVCKAQVYVMGSMMLELLVNKYMSGESFGSPYPDLSSGAAYDNIMTNWTHLRAVLSAANVSDKFQRILVNMLDVSPAKRCCLSDVVTMLHQH